MCAAVIAFQQAAQHSSALSDAGNWAAITAAVILVVGGVLGWFHRASHALHVVGENVGFHHDHNTPSGVVEIIPGLDLFNSSGIPLAYDVVRFDLRIDDRAERDVRGSDHRGYVAAQQKRDWRADERELVEFDEFPIEVVVRYEVQYGRKNRLLWWWRRALRGSFRATVPLTAEPITLLTEPVEGPATDTRVPLTKLSILGWRL